MRPAGVVVSAQGSSSDCNPAFFSATTSAMRSNSAVESARRSKRVTTGMSSARSSRSSCPGRAAGGQPRTPFLEKPAAAALVQPCPLACRLPGRATAPFGRGQPECHPPPLVWRQRRCASRTMAVVLTSKPISHRNQKPKIASGLRKTGADPGLQYSPSMQGWSLAMTYQRRVLVSVMVNGPLGACRAAFSPATWTFCAGILATTSRTPGPPSCAPLRCSGATTTRRCRLRSGSATRRPPSPHSIVALFQGAAGPSPKQLEFVD